MCVCSVHIFVNVHTLSVQSHVGLHNNYLCFHPMFAKFCSNASIDYIWTPLTWLNYHFTAYNVYCQLLIIAMIVQIKKINYIM